MADVDSRLYHDPDVIDPVAKLEPLPENLLFTHSHHSSECATPGEYSAPSYEFDPSMAMSIGDFHSLSPYAVSDNTMDATYHSFFP